MFLEQLAGPCLGQGSWSESSMVFPNNSFINQTFGQITIFPTAFWGDSLTKPTIFWGDEKTAQKNHTRCRMPLGRILAFGSLEAKDGAKDACQIGLSPLVSG